MQNINPGDVSCDKCNDCKVEARLNTCITINSKTKKEIRFKLRQKLCKKF